MAFAEIVRTGLIALVAVCGVAGLLGALTRTLQPVARCERLLSGLGCMLLVSSLLRGIMNRPTAVLCAAMGIGCLIGWFVLIYRQSLHNTTM